MDLRLPFIILSEHPGPVSVPLVAAVLYWLHRHTPFRLSFPWVITIRWKADVRREQLEAAHRRASAELRGLAARRGDNDRSAVAR